MSDTDDVVAIWRLQSRYADVITRRAWPELHELFRPDTTVDIDVVTAPRRSYTGPDDFGAFVAAAIKRYDHFTFVILNTVVDITGPDAARGRLFMCEIRHDRDSDTWQNAHGVYEDTYARVDDRWWFAERRYRSMARTGPDGAVLGLPDDLEPLG
jgi:SnoaL-like domain